MNEGQAIQTERLMMQRSGGVRESFARNAVEGNPFLHGEEALRRWRRQRISAINFAHPLIETIIDGRSYVGSKSARDVGDRPQQVDLVPTITR
jgi:hypothetical protein